MEWILKYEKKIITCLLTGLFLLVSVIIISVSIECFKISRIEIGKSIYEDAHNLYFYGEGIEYSYNDLKERVYAEIDHEKYYKIENYDNVFEKKFTDKELKQLYNIFEITKMDNSYFVKDIGRGVSNYIETNLKIKKIRMKKLEFVASSVFCKKDKLTAFGCLEEDRYTIDKKFIIVKEYGSWKVDEYTSVFEFSDSEFK